MTNKLIDFTDKIVLVTGGSSGIGQATAIGFAKYGATVIVADLDEGKASDAMRSIAKEGVSSLFVKTDVSKSADVKNLMDTIIEKFGRIDCAFNNAGISPSPKPMHEIDEAEWDRIISIDLKGCMLCIKYELQYMIKAGKGAIVNTTSLAGLGAEPNSGPYVAAKHGVVGLTKAAALENAFRGIRVNAVAPGWVRTTMTKDWDDDKAYNEQLKQSTPMHRGAEPDEIAGIVLFLASDAASYITGQTYAVEGGMSVKGMMPVTEN